MLKNFVTIDLPPSRHKPTMTISWVWHKENWNPIPKIPLPKISQAIGSELFWQLNSNFSIFVFFSGPQFADIVMDQCQTDDKLGIDIKDEVGEKCEVHGKKQSEFFVECWNFHPLFNWFFCRRWNRTEVTLVQQWGSHCQACRRNGTDVSSFRRGNETKSYQLSCN